MGSADNTKQLLKEFVARESAATSINSAARMGQLPDWRDAWFTRSEDFDHRQGRNKPCRIWMRVPKNHHG